MVKFDWIFNNTNNFDYDSDYIEIDTVNAVVKLKDLGSGTYSVDNPYLVSKIKLYSEDIINFTRDAELDGDDLNLIRFILIKNGVDYWHDGNDWIDSDGTYAESNCACDINTNIADYIAIGDRDETQLKIFLHSELGISTPELSTVCVEYNFGKFISYNDLSSKIQPLDLVRLSNDDEINNTFVNQSRLNRCIENGESEIIGFLLSLYTQPFPVVPNIIKLINIDLALYYLYSYKQFPPEAILFSYEKRLEMLKLIQNGEVVLDIDPSDFDFQASKTIVNIEIIEEGKIYPEEILDLM